MGSELSRHDLSRLLDGWTKGDAEALKALVPFVYAELRQLDTCDGW